VHANLCSLLVSRPGNLSIYVSIVDGFLDVVCSGESPVAEPFHHEAEGIFGRQIWILVDEVDGLHDYAKCRFDEQDGTFLGDVVAEAEVAGDTRASVHSIKVVTA
jgi:hypothetical protein